MITGVSVIEQQADAGRTDSQAVTESRSVGEACAHKFFAPPIYPGALRRDRVAEGIFNNASVRVILLQGAAGHGKSTTLQQIKSDHGAKGWLTAWLTLDDADNDPRRFAIGFPAFERGVVGNLVAPN